MYNTGKSLIIITIVALFITSLSGCSFLLVEMMEEGEAELGTDNPDEPVDPEEPVVPQEPSLTHDVIQVDSDSITLAWDSSAEDVYQYRIYYKVLDGTDSILLTETDYFDTATVEVEIPCDHFAVNNYYVIGVEAVDSEGNASEVHFSTDTSAYPESWVLEVI